MTTNYLTGLSSVTLLYCLIKIQPYMKDTPEILWVWPSCRALYYFLYVDVHCELFVSLDTTCHGNQYRPSQQCHGEELRGFAFHEHDEGNKSSGFKTGLSVCYKLPVNSLVCFKSSHTLSPDKSRFSSVVSSAWFESNIVIHIKTSVQINPTFTNTFRRICSRKKKTNIYILFRNRY